MVMWWLRWSSSAGMAGVEVVQWKAEKSEELVTQEREVAKTWSE